MDSFNISEQEIDKILSVNGITIAGLTQSEKDNIVSDLFKDSYQLMDFYIASHTDKEIFRNVTYTLDSINNLSVDEEEELANILLLNPNEENFIERLTRILNYLDLIVEPFDLGIYENMFYGAEYGVIKNLCIIVKGLKEFCLNDNFWEELLIYKYGNDSLIDSLDAEMTYLAKEIFKKYSPPKTVENSIIEILKGSKRVDIYWNITNENDMKAISKAFKFNTSLKNLEFFDNGIKGKEIKILMKALENNNSLQLLTISRNDIDKEGSKAIAKMLKVNKSLKNLDLSENNIRQEEIEEIVKALKVNKSLQWLSIRGNNIGDKGAKAIAEALKVNTSLLELNISWNNIKDEGAKVIAEALKVNTSLQILQIFSSYIRDDIKKMLKEIASNKSINIYF